MTKKITIFLAPLLIFFAHSSAYAGCSWVLWFNNETYNADHSHDNSYRAQDAFKDIEECKAKKERLSRKFAASIVDGYKKNPSPEVERIDDVGTEVIVSYRNNAKGFFRYLCLPDTVNPGSGGEASKGQ